jgi:hypothetical protein
MEELFIEVALSSKEISSLSSSSLAHKLLKLRLKNTSEGSEV